MNDALLSSKKMDWCTPKKFFAELDREFHFVLDAAATEQTAKCPRYYTPESDGLAQSWDVGGAVFCNPPYGREIGKWVKKAHDEAMRGGGTLLCCSFPRGRTLPIFTITYTNRRKSASFADVSHSKTKTATLPRPLRSRPCL